MLNELGIADAVLMVTIKFRLFKKNDYQRFNQIQLIEQPVKATESLFL